MRGPLGLLARLMSESLEASSNSLFYVLETTAFAAGFEAVVLLFDGHFPHAVLALVLCVILAKSGFWLKDYDLARTMNSFLIFVGVGAAIGAVIGAVVWTFMPSQKASGLSHQTSAAPDFKLSLLGGNVFTPDQSPSYTGIALEVRIRNAGGQSIATDWALDVHKADGQRIHAQLTKPPNALTLKGPNTGVVQLRAEDFGLERLATATPLKVGDPPLQSQLLFYVAMPLEEVRAASTVLVLSVSDFAGRTFSANQRMGDWPQR